MTKFLVTYHGGAAPTPESIPAMMTAFEEWTTNHSAVVVDGGSPVVPAGRVATGDAEPLAPIGGYSIMEGSEADVQAALQAHPFVARGGTLQLNVVLDPSQLAPQA